MSESEPQPLIDYERHRRDFEERRREFARHPERAKIVTRAKIRLVHDFLKEAQVGPYRITSDEATPRGGGEAPAPLQYFVAAVGF